MYLCIRDDDTCFFTSPDELERAYGAILMAFNLNEAFTMPWLVATLSCVGSAAFLSHASALSAVRMQVRPALVRDRRRAFESHSSI